MNERAELEKEKRRKKLEKAMRQEFGRRMIMYMWVRSQDKLPGDIKESYSALRKIAIPWGANFTDDGEETRGEDEADGEEGGGTIGASYWYAKAAAKAEEMTREK